MGKLLLFLSDEKGTLKNSLNITTKISTNYSYLENFTPLQGREIATVLIESNLDSSLRAAIDTALYDWLGKKVNLPLWKLLGLNCDRIVPTSVTIGISSSEKAIERVRNWLNFIDVKLLKILS